jgi:hypothetical protein
MLERVPDLMGREFALDDYFADFEARFWQVHSTWKLERRQVFQEPDVASWAAMAEGDRVRALALADEMRDGIAEHQRRLDERGIIQRRVRIVELPLTDYLWWELYVLRIRADLGERIRVLPSSAVASWEKSGRTLPEIIVLGDRITYEVRYDGDGVVTEARLLTDRSEHLGDVRCRNRGAVAAGRGPGRLSLAYRSTGGRPRAFLTRRKGSSWQIVHGDRGRQGRCTAGFS